MLNDPQLLFVAGPNGAGKSTFSKELSEPDAVIFDADKVVARIEAQSPNMPKREVYRKMTNDFFKQVITAIEFKRHFTLETNFRDDNLVNIVSEFKRLGYTTNMIYLALENIEQSIDRVNERVASGGHFVDLKTIEENYDLGLKFLEHYAGNFDNLEIINASNSTRQLHSLLSIRGRNLQYLSKFVDGKVGETVNAIAEKFNPPSLQQELDPYDGPSR